MYHNVKMNSSIERVFRPTQHAGVYQEVLLHFIHTFDANGQKTSSRLDKQSLGKLYRLVGEDEQRHSPYGEVEYTFPSGERRKLVALNINVL